MSISRPLPDRSSLWEGRIERQRSRIPAIPSSYTSSFFNSYIFLIAVGNENKSKVSITQKNILESTVFSSESPGMRRFRSRSSAIYAPREYLFIRLALKGQKNSTQLYSDRNKNQVKSINQNHVINKNS